jgi:hypothetical protein
MYADRGRGRAGMVVIGIVGVEIVVAWKSSWEAV